LAGKADSETVAVQEVEWVIVAGQGNSAAAAPVLRIAAAAQAAWVVAQEVAAVPSRVSIAVAAQRVARASAAAPVEQALAEPEPGVDPEVEAGDGADKQGFRCQVSGGA
jgi:hypothetical protein